MSEQNTTDMSQHFYRASAADFMKIPGSPITYWIGEPGFNIYKNSINLKDKYKALTGMRTGDNNLFLRFWQEVSWEKTGIYFNKVKARESNKKWFPYNKGGGFNKWYGNNELLVNWKDDGQEIKNLTKKNYPDLGDNLSWKITNENSYFKSGITWGGLTSATVSFRWSDCGALFDSNKGAMIFPSEEDKFLILGFLNSSVVSFILNAVNPTLSTQNRDIDALPLIIEKVNEIKPNINKLIFSIISLSKLDDKISEVSWEFRNHLLLFNNLQEEKIKKAYNNLRKIWVENIQEVQSLEKENNRIFIEAYGLQDELNPDVPLKEITLTCNPHYRYGGDLTEQEREDRLQSDTIAELISYAIGCMMGRYSLDREGLVYAHAGNQGFAELVSEGAYTTFAADDDAILPITEQEWFTDDVTNRVSEFVRTVYDEQHLEENLQFIADSLCLYAIKPKKGERALETIRRYLGTQFYKDHLKTYKRRPIYWLFSSGKHKAFECLVYLHRYHEGTLARMRTEYVIPLTARINARINRLHEEAEAASSTSERNQLNRELKTLQNQQAELATFDEQLRHHADQRISLDLDDGVKENYGKFGDLLAAVKDVTGK